MGQMTGAGRGPQALPQDEGCAGPNQQCSGVCFSAALVADPAILSSRLRLSRAGWLFGQLVTSIQRIANSVSLLAAAGASS
jgi:hypothetical protein